MVLKTSLKLQVTVSGKKQNNILWLSREPRGRWMEPRRRKESVTDVRKRRELRGDEAVLLCAPALGEWKAELLIGRLISQSSRKERQSVKLHTFPASDLLRKFRLGIRIFRATTAVYFLFSLAN